MEQCSSIDGACLCCGTWVLTANCMLSLCRMHVRMHLHPFLYCTSLVPPTHQGYAYWKDGGSLLTYDSPANPTVPTEPYLSTMQAKNRASNIPRLTWHLCNIQGRRAIHMAQHLATHYTLTCIVDGNKLATMMLPQFLGLVLTFYTHKNT